MEASSPFCPVSAICSHAGFSPRLVHLAQEVGRGRMQGPGLGLLPIRGGPGFRPGAVRAVRCWEGCSVVGSELVIILHFL